MNAFLVTRADRLEGSNVKERFKCDVFFFLAVRGNGRVRPIRIGENFECQLADGRHVTGSCLPEYLKDKAKTRIHR